MTDSGYAHLGSPTLNASIGYFRNAWVRRDTIQISIDDIGFRSGVTAVERLRTYGQKVFELDAHLVRLTATLRELRITGLPGQAEMANLVNELLERNTEWLESQASRDCGITIIATPGESGSNEATFAMHVSVIDQERVKRFRTLGQPLRITGITQQPESTWSRKLKVRSRLHYYLADTLAKEIAADAVGVLIDDDGTVTETSIANVAMVLNGEIHSPVESQVLGGITQSVIERLANSNGVAWHHRRLSPQELRQADDVLLMGTENGLWFANRVDDREFSLAGMSDVFRALLAAFDDLTLGRN